MGIFKQAYNRDFEEQAPYFNWIAGNTDIGIKTYMKMQSCFPSPKAVFEAGDEKRAASGVFTRGQLKLMNRACKDDILKDYDRLRNLGITHLVWESDEYPARLKEIPDPPVSLYVKGELKTEEMLSVAVIGTRECSFYGTEVAAAFGEALAANDAALVSGMARGIDSLSQIAAVDAGGYSCAVLGGGVDIVYPRESLSLYRQLSRNGAIVSEYPPGTMPRSAFFARRNRIISGLADVVCVVEARLKSGTMITVDCALEQGREVYAVPGRITDKFSRGCHELIKQGAGIVADVDLFVEEMCENYGRLRKNFVPVKTFEAPDAGNMSGPEARILRAAGEDSFIIEDMTKTTGMSFEETFMTLNALVSRGMCINMGAGRFRLSGRGIKARNSTDA